MRHWARFFGTDMNFYKGSDDDPEASQDTTQPARIMPLAAIINPEVFKHLAEEGAKEHEEVDTDAYEMQIAQLEAGGLLTDIDEINKKAEEKLAFSGKPRVKRE